jgi:DNA helicase HerA-like ATPase
VVGRIVHRRRDTRTDYRIALSSLTRHVFVAGVTGSGKTNTIFALLAEAAAAGVPFLVIEPAKTEYRALIDHPAIGDRVRVFTAGQAGVGPLLLNPFEVPPGTTVSEHLDLVRVKAGTTVSDDRLDEFFAQWLYGTMKPTITPANF